MAFDHYSSDDWPLTGTAQWWGYRIYEGITSEQALPDATISLIWLLSPEHYTYLFAIFSTFVAKGHCEGAKFIKIQICNFWKHIYIYIAQESGLVCIVRKSFVTIYYFSHERRSISLKLKTKSMNSQSLDRGPYTNIAPTRTICCHHAATPKAPIISSPSP